MHLDEEFIDWPPSPPDKRTRLETLGDLFFTLRDAYPIEVNDFIDPKKIEDPADHIQFWGTSNPSFRFRVGIQLVRQHSTRIRTTLGRQLREATDYLDVQPLISAQIINTMREERRRIIANIITASAHKSGMYYVEKQQRWDDIPMLEEALHRLFEKICRAQLLP